MSQGLGGWGSAVAQPGSGVDSLDDCPTLFQSLAILKLSPSLPAVTFESYICHKRDI